MDEEENQCEYLEEEMVPLKKWVLRDGKSIGERGLKIKFTLGKGNSSEGSEEGLVGPEPEQDPEPGSRSRVCKVCKKVFSSGRALGGHMRVHNNQVEDDEFLGNKPNLKLNKFKTPITNLSFLHPNNADYSCQNSDGTATCAICDKVFPSLKSLFGHMRCHPDRDWRGVQPPTTGNNSSSSTVTEQKMEDLIESTTTIRSSCPNQVPSLPSWSVTGKRGRTNGGPEAKAAYELMMLSRGEGSVAGNKDLGSKKMKKEEKRNVFDEKPVWSNGTEEESSDDEDEEEEEPVSKYTDYNKYPVGPDVRKRIRMKKFREIETMQNMGVNVTVYKQSYSHSHTTPDRFKCTTCDKSFPTHQALGGHRSSHYKGKACQTEEGEQQQYEVLPMIPSNFTQLIDPTELHGFGSTATMVRTSHRCRICNRTFPTGQALGGHKRCHWTAPTDTLASTGTGRRMLDFDLNEPANIEDVEQGMKQPDDYASSS